MKRKTRVIKIGNLKIGGDNPVAIQSMVKTKTSKIEETIRQIKDLEKSGCEIIRLAIKDMNDVKAIKRIRAETRVPLVGDIHFDYRLGIEVIRSGIDKIRLNPANIHKRDEIGELVRAAKDYKIPIRVGVNSGSLRNHQSSSLSSQSQSDRMVKAALDYIKILEGFGFYDIVVSLKASNTLETIEAYRKMSRVCNYPFHLGLTATGSFIEGVIKSSIAIGVLLLEGIGDTIRVSLTDNPEQEVRVARSILQTLGLRHFSPEIVSCPACGRCQVDLISIVKELEEKLSTVNCSRLTLPLKLAVMGCEVNGPGEAKDADIGVAFGKERGLVFKKGKVIRKIRAEEAVDTLLEELR